MLLLFSSGSRTLGSVKHEGSPRGNGIANAGAGRGPRRVRRAFKGTNYGK